MRALVNFQIDLDHINNYFDSISCFLHSASTLYGAACDGIVKNNNGSIGFATNDFWNSNLIVVFYLLRHALELAIKALIQEITNKETTHHNIKKMWSEVQNNSQLLAALVNIDPALNILAKYHILEDEQLLRYHKDKKGTELKNLIPVTDEDLSIITNAVYSVRDLILEHVHIRDIESQINS